MQNAKRENKLQRIVCIDAIPLRQENKIPNTSIDNWRHQFSKELMNCFIRGDANPRLDTRNCRKKHTFKVADTHLELCSPVIGESCISFFVRISMELMKSQRGSYSLMGMHWLSIAEHATAYCETRLCWFCGGQERLAAALAHSHWLILTWMGFVNSATTLKISCVLRGVIMRTWVIPYPDTSSSFPAS